MNVCIFSPRGCSSSPEPSLAALSGRQQPCSHALPNNGSAQPGWLLAMPRCAIFSRFIEAEDALGSRFGERGSGNAGERSSAKFLRIRAPELGPCRHLFLEAGAAREARVQRGDAAGLLGNPTLPAARGRGAARSWGSHPLPSREKRAGGAEPTEEPHWGPGAVPGPGRGEEEEEEEWRGDGNGECARAAAEGREAVRKTRVNKTLPFGKVVM